MNKLFFALILPFAIANASVAQTPIRKFEIIGNLTGYADSTRIYLYENKTHDAFRIDSAYIIHNQFHFAGSLKEPVINVSLEVKGFPNDYKFFWLENSVITFTAEKGKLRKAIIKGSKTQDEEIQFDAAPGTGKEKEITFIRNHPNSIISVQLLAVMASSYGKDTSTALYNNLSEGMKGTLYGKNVLNFITLTKALHIGDQYADFTELNTEGKNISLSDFKDKVVLLDFWGSWCGPCRANNKDLVKLYDDFKNKGFEILGVAADFEKKSWIEAINTDGLKWPNVTDLKGWENKAAVIYGVSQYPTSYLIDREGKIIAKNLEGDALRNKLREIL